MISKQRTTRSFLTCKCKKCSHTWNPRLDHVEAGHGCPKCIRPHAKSDIEQVIRALKTINPNIKVLSKKYVNGYTKLKCVCVKCRSILRVPWNQLRKGIDCLKCVWDRWGNERRLSLQSIRIKMRSINPTIEIIGPYRGGKFPLQCKCKNCAHVWSPTWTSLNNGHGCPRCYAGSSSEEKVRATLQFLTGLQWPRANPSLIPWLHGLTLDGYCVSLKSAKFPNGTAFEYQGYQHYRLAHWHQNLQQLNTQQKRDRRKKIQCWRHGVRLVVIPYWVKNLTEYLRNRL